MSQNVGANSQWAKYSTVVNCWNLKRRKLPYMSLFFAMGVIFLFSSVQFSCLVRSNSLQPHETQHARPPCPSPTPRVYPNPCPLSRWCHPTILSSVVPFSSCPQSFPASGCFPVSGLFASLTQWTWVWVNSGSWWWTGRPGMLQFMGSQRVGHDWATELNWTDHKAQEKEMATHSSTLAWKIP